MKIIVTGATGFLGSNLVHALVSKGHQVVILKRSFSNATKIESVLQNTTYYDLDLCSIEEIFQEQRDVDAVIHTATLYGRKHESASEVFKANTWFPMNLLEIACKNNIKTFINTDTVLQKETNYYSLSKKQFLEWGRQFSLNGQIRFINILLEHMYGPGDDVSKFTTYIIKSCINNIPELKLTLGEQKRDFIYIDDVVSAYLLLLETALINDDFFLEYEVGTGTVITIRNLVELVHRVTVSKTKLMFGELPYRENELMESKANIQPLLELGWAPKTSIETGLEITIEGERYK